MPDISFSQLNTLDDAIRLVDELFDRQLLAAERARTAPNESCPGDTEARDAFLLLLPPAEQRLVFLQRARSRSFWPRIRTCVGAPPFSFLRPEDDQVLRAAGIERNRVHMSSDTSVPNSVEFGRTGQFSDGQDRDYKLLASDSEGTERFARRAAPLPFMNLREGDRVIADVRLKKRTKKAKLEILRGVDTSVSKSALTFPARGSRVEIEPSKLLVSVVGSLSLRVQNVIPRGSSSSVARLICIVI